MTLDDILAAVQAEDTQVKAITALLATVKGELDAAIASGYDPTKLQALSELIGSDTTALANAIAAAGGTGTSSSSASSTSSTSSSSGSDSTSGATS